MEWIWKPSSPNHGTGKPPTRPGCSRLYPHLQTGQRSGWEQPWEGHHWKVSKMHGLFYLETIIFSNILFCFIEISHEIYIISYPQCAKEWGYLALWLLHCNKEKDCILETQKSPIEWESLSGPKGKNLQNQTIIDWFNLEKNLKYSSNFPIMVRDANHSIRLPQTLYL